MNNTIFFRLIWKEFRQVRAFAICLLAIGLLLQLILLATASMYYQSPGVTLIAYLFPALFMAGSAATIFSMEHENKSFMLQRMLPVSARTVFAAKVLVSAVLAIAILLTLSAIPQVVGVRFFQSVWVKPASLLLLTAEFLVWGTLFSVIDRRPLRSLVLAVGCPVIIAGLIFAVDAAIADSSVDPGVVHPMVVVIRLFVIAIVGAIAFQRAASWFEEREYSARGFPWTSRSGKLSSSRFQHGSVARWQRLFWLQQRSTLWPMLGITAVCFAGVVYFSSEGAGIRGTDTLTPFMLVSVSAGAILGAMIGSLVWHAAGQRRAFLANHGIHGQRVWLVQIVIGMVFCGGFCGLSLLLASVLYWQQPDEVLLDFNLEYINRPLMFSFCIASAFAWSQLIAHYARTTWMAVIVGTLIGVCSVAFPLFCFTLHVPVWFGPVVWVVLPLVITFVIAHAWLLDLKRRAMVHVGLAASVIITFSLFIGYRAFEFPAVNEQRVAELLAVDTPVPKVAVEEFRSLNTELSDLMRIRHWNRIEKAQRKAEPQRLALLEKILNLPSVEVAQIPDVSGVHTWIHARFENFLITSLVMATHDGELALGERIINRLPAESRYGLSSLFYDYVEQWALHPDNDSERVARVAKLMLEKADLQPRIANSIQAELRITWECLAEGPGRRITEHQRRLRSRSVEEVSALVLFDRLTFWESTRGRRLLGKAITLEAELREYSRRCITSDVPFENAINLPQNLQADFSSELNGYFDIAAESLYLLNLDGETTYFLFRRYFEVSRKRARALLLAIIAWKMDHDGAVPNELSQLVPKYLDKVPTDPYTGRPFYWFPNGIDIEKATEFLNHRDADWSKDDRYRHQVMMLAEAMSKEQEPFLWSPETYCRRMIPDHYQQFWHDMSSPVPYHIELNAEELNVVHINFLGVRHTINDKPPE